MKKQITMAALSLSVVLGAWGQNAYDAVNIINKDLNGTARFVGMGGAMGALGGDISTIGTNPAGIGLFRSNDVTTSFSFSTMGTESKYDGNTFNENKNRFSLDNVGVVFSTKIGNETPLRYLNFGFNYHRAKSFYRTMSMQGIMPADQLGPMSQVRQMAEQANDAASQAAMNGRGIDFGGNDIFYNSDAGWLGALGWNGQLMYQNQNNIYTPIIPHDPDVLFQSRESGGVDQYDFNVALNLSDRVYLGLTVGAYDVDYTKDVLYDEDYGNGEGYQLWTRGNISGSGVDFKLGAIIRPFEYSPLRIGLAIHTPTFYDLTLGTGAILNSNVFIGDNATKTTSYEVNTYNEVNGKMKRDFKLNTPWKYNLSLGYTVGKYLALGAEYEYQDYSTMKFEYSDGDKMPVETEYAKNETKGVNTIRVGAEYKVIPEFAFRLGYNYTSALFKDNTIKQIPANSTQTDTDFSNTKSQNDYTIGFGYRGAVFYADLAYKLTSYKSDFYPFYNVFYQDATHSVTVVPQPTKVTNTRSQVLLTLGMRF